MINKIRHVQSWMIIYVDIDSTSINAKMKNNALSFVWFHKGLWFNKNINNSKYLHLLFFQAQLHLRMSIR